MNQLVFFLVFLLAIPVNVFSSRVVLIITFNYDSCPISTAQLVSFTIRYPNGCEPYISSGDFYFCENNQPKKGSCGYDCLTLSQCNQVCYLYNPNGPSIVDVVSSACNKEILCIDVDSFDINIYLKRMLSNPSLDQNEDIYAQSLSIGVYNETLYSETNVSSGNCPYNCFKNKETNRCDDCDYSSRKWELTNYPYNECSSKSTYFNPNYIVEEWSVLFQKKPTHTTTTTTIITSFRSYISWISSNNTFFKNYSYNIVVVLLVIVSLLFILSLSISGILFWVYRIKNKNINWNVEK